METYDYDVSAPDFFEKHGYFDYIPATSEDEYSGGAEGSAEFGTVAANFSEIENSTHQLSRTIITEDRKIPTISSTPVRLPTPADHETYESDWLKVGFTILLFVVGCLATIYVLASTGIRRKWKAEPVKWYLLNVVVCNLCFLCTFPLFLVEDLMVAGSSNAVALCLSRDLALFINSFATVTLLTVCAVEFCRRPQRHVPCQKAEFACKVTASVWFAALLISFLAVLLRKFSTLQAVNIVLVALPSTLFFLYVLTIGSCLALAEKKQMAGSNRKTNLPSVSSDIDIHPIAGRGSGETLRTTTLLVIWCFACYAVFHVLQLISAFEVNRQDGTYCKTYGAYIFLIAYVNATLNPFLCNMRLVCNKQ